MFRRWFIFTILIMVTNIAICGSAFSLCYESGGGKLNSGSISEYLSSIISTYENDVPRGCIYTVQKLSGYYFKICDEPSQVKHFMEKWACPAVANGEWQSILSTQNKNDLQIISEIGVYKIIKIDDIWSVWKFNNNKLQKVALFINSNPANARIRILNIKQKFYQGIYLKPGKYHIEVSSNGYELYKKWIELKVGKNNININLGMIDSKKTNYGRQIPVHVFESLRKMRFLELKISQRYKNAPDIDPSSSIVKQIVNYIPVPVYTSSQEKEYTALEIMIQGEALSNRYSSSSWGGDFTTQYSGASVQGSIIFKTNNNVLFKRYFNYKIATPKSINRTYKIPSAAPFQDALHNRDSLSGTLVDTLIGIYGTDWLCKAIDELLKYDSRKLYKSGKENLIEAFLQGLGRTKKPIAIPILEKVLKSKKWASYQKVDAAWALGEIGDPTSIEILNRTLAANNDTQLQTEVIFALRKIRGPIVIENRKEWQSLQCIDMDEGYRRCYIIIPTGKYYLVADALRSIPSVSFSKERRIDNDSKFEIHFITNQDFDKIQKRLDASSKSKVAK